MIISFNKITFIRKLGIGGIPARFSSIMKQIHLSSIFLFSSFIFVIFAFFKNIITITTLTQYKIVHTLNTFVFTDILISIQLKLNTDESARISNTFLLFICRIAPIKEEAKMKNINRDFIW
jgi:hypothetical protein